MIRRFACLAFVLVACADAERPSSASEDQRELSPGAVAWASSFGDASGFGYQDATAIAATGDGGAIVAGYFERSLELGGERLESAGNADLFVAKLDAEGEPVWARRFGDAADQTYVAGVAVAGDGSVYLAGGVKGEVDFGAGAVRAAGKDTAGFVAKLGEGGETLWVKGFGEGGSAYARGLAVDAAGDVVVAGEFYGSVDLGGGALENGSADNYEDVFVAKLDADGGHVWSVRAGGERDDSAGGVALGPEGEVFVAGAFKRAASFGEASLESNHYGLYVWKLSPSGETAWVKGYDETREGVLSSIQARAVAAGPDGVVVTGAFQGRYDLGGVAVESTESADATRDLFVLSLDADGDTRFSGAYGGPAEEHPMGLAVGEKGEILLSGTSQGGIDFGGGLLARTGFLVFLDASGSPVFGATFDAVPASLALGAHSVLVAGQVSDAVAIGAERLSAGYADVFVAKFAR